MSLHDDDRLLGLDEAMRDSALLLAGDPAQYLETIRRAAARGDQGAAAWLRGEVSVGIDPEAPDGVALEASKARG